MVERVLGAAGFKLTNPPADFGALFKGVAKIDEAKMAQPSPTPPPVDC